MQAMKLLVSIMFPKYSTPFSAKSTALRILKTLDLYGYLDGFFHHFSDIADELLEFGIKRDEISFFVDCLRENRISEHEFVIPGVVKVETRPGSFGAPGLLGENSSQHAQVKFVELRELVYDRELKKLKATAEKFRIKTETLKKPSKISEFTNKLFAMYEIIEIVIRKRGFKNYGPVMPSELTASYFSTSAR